jgi:hypothetical protein
MLGLVTDGSRGMTGELRWGGGDNNSGPELGGGGPRGQVRSLA